MKRFLSALRCLATGRHDFTREREDRRFADPRPNVEWDRCRRCGLQTEPVTSESNRNKLLDIQASLPPGVMRIQGIDYGPGWGSMYGGDDD